MTRHQGEDPRWQAGAPEPLINESSLSEGIEEHDA
jgi:hypothetical protein